jgi:uncharacterized delta-60 repeat protein
MGVADGVRVGTQPFEALIMSLLLRTLAALALLLTTSLALGQSLSGFVDPSFNGFGWSIGPFRGENERLSSSAENTQGMRVAVGTQGSSTPQCIVVRYRDSAFIGASTLPLPGLSLVFCSKVLALADGSFRILGAGLQANGQYSALVIALTADGLLDTSFQQQGLRLLNADFSWLESTEQTLLNSATLDAQGRVLAVGRVLNSANNTSRGLVVRLLSDGSLDTGFAVDGSRPLADYNPPTIFAHSTALDSAGRVYVMGHTVNPGTPDAGVIFRLLDDGQIDFSFGLGMDAPLRIGGGGRGFLGQCYRVTSLLLDGQDRMVLGCEPDPSGATPGPIRAAGVLRLGSDGQPDSEFGDGDGYVEPLAWNSPVGYLRDAPRVTLSDSGQLVVAGTLVRAAGDPDPQDLYVIRLNADGAVSGAFGSNGTHQSNYTIDLWQNSDFKLEELAELRLDARGRVVLSGNYANALSGTTETYGLIARLGMADPEANAGFLDPDFSFRGYRLQRIDDVTGPRRSTLAEDLTLDAQGRAVVIGSLYLETSPLTSVCGISRNLPDGRPDPSFSGNGQRGISLIAGGETYCNAVQALPSGELLVAGWRSGVDYTATVIRLQDDGSVDTQFWGDGVLELSEDLGLGARQISAFSRAMTLDAQGRVLLLASGRAIGAQDPGFQCGFGNLNDECGLLIRLFADGSLDTGFGNNGLVLLISPTNPSRIRVGDLKLDLSGNILVTAADGSFPSDESAVLYEIGDDGVVNQRLRLRSSTGCVAAFALAVDSSNARLLGCSRPAGGAVLRLLPNNAVDLNFGLGGLAAVNFYTNGSGSTASVTAILPQWDNSLVVVGNHQQGSPWEALFGRSDVGVTKFDRFGSLIPYPFFGAGYGSRLRFPDLPGAFDEVATTAKQQPDGRIVVAGTFSDVRPGVPQQDSTQMFLARISNPQPEPLAPEVFSDGFE